MKSVADRRAFVSLITLLAFGLRAYRLNLQPLWWDEGYSLYFASMDLGAMVAGTAGDIHPPLYYTLLHFWISLLGSGAVAVRLLSVLAGTLTVPLFYLVGRRLVDGKVGMLASLVMAIAPFHIYYSQEVRMYGLVTLLGLLSVYFVLLLLETWATESKRRQILLWAGYVIVTLAAMYTQYYAAFIPLFQTVFVIGSFALSQLKQRARPNHQRGISTVLLIRWLIAQGILLLLYIPWIIYAGGQLTGYVVGKVGHEGYRSLGLWAFLGQHLGTFGLGHLAPDQSHLYWVGSLFFLLALLGVLGYSRIGSGWIGNLATGPPDYKSGGSESYSLTPHRRQRLVTYPGQGSGASIVFLLLYLFVPLLMAFFINLRFPFAPIGMERLSLLAVPAYYLLIGLGLAWLWRGPRPLFGLFTLALICASGFSLYGFYTVERYPQDDYRPLVAKVQTMAAPDDAVFCIYPWQVGYFESYYRGEQPHIVLASSGEWGPFIQRELEELLAEGERLWVPAYQAKGGIMESQVERFLLANSYPILNQWYGTTRLSFYAPESQMTASQGPLNFDDRLRLLEYALAPGPMEAGWGVVTADLLWLKERRLDGHYLVGLRLTDQAGRTWGQRDSEPMAGLCPFSDWREGEQMLDRHGLLVPAGTPSGDYQLRLRVYRATDEQGLTVLDENAIPQGTEAVLGTVQVVPPGQHPPVEALAIGHPLSADLADSEKGPILRLLGYSLGEGPLKPGQVLKLTLFWQALADVSRDYIVFVQLQDEKGKLWANRETSPVDGSYPTAGWQTGQLVRDPHDFVVPASAPDGPYHLIVGLYRLIDGERLAVMTGPQRGRDSLALTEVNIRGREHDYQKPVVSHPLQARFGESIVLIGYDLEAQQARPGDRLGLTLYWHALSTVDTSYTVFVHLLDADEVIQGWGDSLPGGGTLPTTSWLEGEYLRDGHEIAIKPEAPSSEYLIEVGLYEATSGERLPILDEEGQVHGDSILLADTIRVLTDDDG
jgi:4-amino-4-deoxy-L-arabinose transferase-like glycosyltransferase